MAVNWFFCVAFVHLAGPALALLRRLQRRAHGAGAENSDAVDHATVLRAERAVKEASDLVLIGEPNLCGSPQELWLRVLYESDRDYLNFVELYMVTLLQFGYVALFSPAFPLAGTVAVISNAVGIRIDTWKVFRAARRPLPEGAQDIGAWAILFLFVSVLAVLTNCAVITVTTTRPLFNVTVPATF